jgi:acyl-CoA thioesterase
MPSAQDIADATFKVLRVQDRVAQALGMQALADSAFGFASNSYNEQTVSSGLDVNLLAAAALGDVLTATACEISKAGRTGLVDVRVTNQRGEAVALLRCRSYAIKGRAVVAGLPIGRAAAG